MIFHLQGTETVNKALIPPKMDGKGWRAWHGRSQRLQAEHEQSRDRAAFAASLVLPGVLLTHSSLKHFRLSFGKLFPFFLFFFFFLQVIAKWKTLSLPKLQPLSSLLKRRTFFPVCNFLLHHCRKRLWQCSVKGFKPRGRVCPSRSLPLVPGDAPVAAAPGAANAVCAARPGCHSPSAAWMLQQITAAVQEQACSHMLLLTSIY